MIVSLNWLKELVDIKDIELDKLEELISLNVIEIEGIKKLVTVSNLTVGHVLECEMHPDSDHLHVCKVDLGDDVYQIVCGAPNVKKGLYVIVARVGAEFPDFTIKKSKIRGVESNGMICSLQELGIEEKYVPEEYKDGIYYFDKEVKPGSNPLEVLGLDDVAIELGLTPNRGDLLSHLGVAYDVAAVTNKKVILPDCNVKEIEKKNDVTVKVDTENCKFYSARKIENVVIKESPWWLKSKLITAGVRPINNVVDITNYVMLLLGQPLHSFDGDVLGNKIVVRNAKKGEVLKTLDDIDRKLEENDVVITDGEKILCLGGIMGGLYSSIENNTKTVVLESAYFDGLNVRKTSSRLGLRSESSVRFERKIDPNRCIMAINLAAKLISELACGNVLSGVSIYDNIDKNDKIIETSKNNINKVLGTNLDKEINDILDRLDFKYEELNGELKISVPTRRVDIEMYQDINEEIARIYGYNNIPTTLPKTDSVGKLNPKQSLTRAIRNELIGLGLNETVNYSLIGSNEDLYALTEEKSVKIAMPMTEDRKIMRKSLINSLVEVVKYNKARKMSDIQIFEIGKVYAEGKEMNRLAIAMSGMFESNLWQGKKQVCDFYLLKGIVESLFDKIGLTVSFERGTHKAYHPGISANIILNGKNIGVFGQIHPSIKAKEDLFDTYILELDLDAVLDANRKEIKFEPISKFPSVTRDIAIVVDKKITAKEIVDLIKQTGKKMLTNVEIFDIYEGEKIKENTKSIAISLTFMNNEGTLETADVDKKVSSILTRLSMVLNAELRK